MYTNVLISHRNKMPQNEKLRNFCSNHRINLKKVQLRYQKLSVKECGTNMASTSKFEQLQGPEGGHWGFRSRAEERIIHPGIGES